MNFKTLTITIVIAASLAALASMPLTATPVYAGGNVKTDQKTHVHNNDGDTTVDQNQECIGQTVTGSCNTTTNNPPGGGGGGGNPNLCTNPQNDKPTGCTPRPT